MTQKGDKLLQMILNLSKYHREHEKFYAQALLQQAISLQQASRVLKTLADRWSQVKRGDPKAGSPYLGCEDLNETTAIQSNGVLFMEGEGEPPEISRLKRDLGTIADDFGETGRWLSEAMRASWETARPLAEYPTLAGVLGERHRIIVNDWQAANLNSLVWQPLRRALDLLQRIDFSPIAVRADLAGPRIIANYLYSVSELIDRAADLASESATLVHDNERRWRVFRDRVRQLTDTQPEGDVAAKGMAGVDRLVAELDSRGLHSAATYLGNAGEELFTVTRIKEQGIAPELVMVATSAVEREFREINRRTEVGAKVDR